MPKGHRRTQSSNLVMSTGDSYAQVVGGQENGVSHEIVSLLAKSN